MSSPAISVPDFYRLGFASQMIVWAARKRLHLLLRGESDANVAEVFALAGLDNLHQALMSILDLLLCGASNRVQVHAVACPCLSPHEISLLNALAHLQGGRPEDAARCMNQLFCETAARLVQPALFAIVESLDARDLLLTSIDGADSSPSARRFNATVH
jgi:hypothetical protein